MRRLSIVLGAIYLALAGRNRFLMTMQSAGLGGVICQALLRSPELRKLIELDMISIAALTCDDRTDYSKSVYATPQLGGYGVGRRQHVADDMTMDEKPRGVGPRIVETLLRPGDRVIEIGCSNGEASAHLARRHPENGFIGLDFYTDAVAQIDLPNLRFVAGYPLQTLDEAAGDVMFAHTTFVLVGPREMECYAQKLSSFRALVFTDPVRSGYRPDRYPGPSRLMIKGLWGHDYRSYFRKHGFERQMYGIFPFVARDGKVTRFQKTLLVRA